METDTSQVSICPKCTSQMDLVCDPSGAHEYYHCFRCETPETQAATLQVFHAYAVLPEDCAKIEVSRNRLRNFLRRLAAEKGSIVSSDSCSVEEIARAKSQGRFIADGPDGFGFVHRAPSEDAK